MRTAKSIAARSRNGMTRRFNVFLPLCKPLGDAVIETAAQPLDAAPR